MQDITVKEILEKQNSIWERNYESRMGENA